ncbi:redox-sensing transcriptional repressor Rex [bacterium]|nr:redox-sensing transcriptional repressor Rex [bacterium]
MYRRKIPGMAITRLSIYSRILAGIDDGRTISSKELAELSGHSDSQLRRDLTYFGQFGIPGKGYQVKELKRRIHSILGIDRTWNVALVGAGNLGSALARYKGFELQGFKIKAVFDNNKRKIGRTLGNVTIQDMEELPRSAKKRNIKIAVITAPMEAAQELASLLTEAGVKAILNFAPVRIFVPSEVKLVNVDLAMELENLSYFLSKAGKENDH